MRQSVTSEGFDGGITGYHLCPTVRRRVAHVCRFNICRKQLTQLGESANHLRSTILRTPAAMEVHTLFSNAIKAQTRLDLLCK